MKVLDPGHRYELEHIDKLTRETTISQITFVKRLGEGYPGNIGQPYSGTTCQEVLRVLIDRVKYLDNQIPCQENQTILFDLRQALETFELRAADRHCRVFPLQHSDYIENIPVCTTCGHLYCDHNKET